MLIKKDILAKAVEGFSKKSTDQYETLCADFEIEQKDLVNMIGCLADTPLSDQLFELAFEIVLVIDDAYRRQCGESPILSTVQIENMLEKQIKKFEIYEKDTAAWECLFDKDYEQKLYAYVVGSLSDHGWSAELPGCFPLVLLLMSVVDVYDECSGK